MTASVPPGRQAIAQRWQRALEAGELVVDGDANGLEEPREIRRHRCAVRARARIAPTRSSLVSNGLVLAAPDDLARETRRARLVAELLEDRVSVALVFVVEKRRGVDRARRAPIRMSSGAPWRKVKPRSSSST